MSTETTDVKFSMQAFKEASLAFVGMDWVGKNAQDEQTNEAAQAVFAKISQAAKEALAEAKNPAPVPETQDAEALAAPVTADDYVALADEEPALLVGSHGATTVASSNGLEDDIAVCWDMAEQLEDDLEGASDEVASQLRNAINLLKGAKTPGDIEHAKRIAKAARAAAENSGSEVGEDEELEGWDKISKLFDEYNSLLDDVKKEGYLNTDEDKALDKEIEAKREEIDNAKTAEEKKKKTEELLQLLEGKDERIDEEIARAKKEGNWEMVNKLQEIKDKKAEIKKDISEIYFNESKDKDAPDKAHSVAMNQLIQQSVQNADQPASPSKVMDSLPLPTAEDAPNSKAVFVIRAEDTPAAEKQPPQIAAEKMKEVDKALEKQADAKIEDVSLEALGDLSALAMNALPATKGVQKG